MKLRYIPISTSDANLIWQGGKDSNQQVPKKSVSDGKGNQCRHCLDFILSGDTMFVLGYRLFETVQPYAEIGPIFIHAERCKQYCPQQKMPPVITGASRFLIRAYDNRDYIRYGSGGTVAAGKLEERAKELLMESDTAYLHVRSANYNCYQCKIEKA